MSGVSDEDWVCFVDTVTELNTLKVRNAKLAAALTRIAYAPNGEVGPTLRDCIEIAREALQQSTEKP